MSRKIPCFFAKRCKKPHLFCFGVKKSLFYGCLLKNARFCSKYEQTLNISFAPLAEEGGKKQKNFFIYPLIFLDGCDIINGRQKDVPMVSGCGADW